jgi:hypothetical protein
VPAVATATVPPGQKSGFVRIEEAAVTAVPRLAFGKGWALEVALHGAATEPHLFGNHIQGPALPMVRPDLLVMGHPLRPSRGGSRRRPSGWQGRWGHVAAWVRRGLGIDARQLRGVRPEHVGQHICQIPQQMKPVGHMEGRRGSQARRFRVGLTPIPHEDFNPGMRLQPPGDSNRLPIGEQGQRPPPGEVQQERAIGMPLPPGEVVDAQDLWEGDRGQGARRITRKSVWRLTRRPKCRLSRTPAAPPRASPTARRRAISRSVRLAQGSPRPGSRSVTMRRGHCVLEQKSLRT